METRKILIVISVSVGGFIYPFWQCTGGARQNAWFGTQEHERRTTMDVLSREKKCSFQVVEWRENLNMAVMVMLIELLELNFTGFHEQQVWSRTNR
ncbi:hypothetical protein LXL04_009799 [Taraxacum kok-saghyz]